MLFKDLTADCVKKSSINRSKKTPDAFKNSVENDGWNEKLKSCFHVFFPCLKLLKFFLKHPSHPALRRLMNGLFAQYAPVAVLILFSHNEAQTIFTASDLTFGWASFIKVEYMSGCGLTALLALTLLTTDLTFVLTSLFFLLQANFVRLQTCRPLTVCTFVIYVLVFFVFLPVLHTHRKKIPLWEGT